MRKVLIALVNELTRGIYAENFSQNEFKAITTASGKEAYKMAQEETPDVIIADVSLYGIGGLELIKKIKEDEKIKKIPVIIYSRTGNELHRKKAMDLEARDFISGVWDSPKKVVSRAKAHLGVQKGYIIHPSEKSLRELKELSGDLGENIYCPSCDGIKSIYLIRDLSFGENYFKISFLCPKCSFRKPRQ